MTLQISIRPSEHSFGCEPDETVLQAAMRADLMIPYGCRNGAQDPGLSRQQGERNAEFLAIGGTASRESGMCDD